MLYKINYINLYKYKLIKYLKVMLNTKAILIIIVFALLSNSYLLYLNSKYNNFYKNVPNTIKAKAIIIRRSGRERI